jgi:hypothetical protein
MLKTRVMLKIAANGPSSTARKVPPIKCPLVPKAIGKLIICAANTNALDIANRAVIEREYVCCAFFQDHAKMPTDIIHIAIAKMIEVLFRINPSDMCMIKLPSVTLFERLVLLEI